jgi:hypothetical protein
LLNVLLCVLVVVLSPVFRGGFPTVPGGSAMTMSKTEILAGDRVPGWSDRGVRAGGRDSFAAGAILNGAVRAFALLGLFLLAPLLAAIALAVRFESNGPVLVRRKERRPHGQVAFYAFRTTLPQDWRVTRTGRWLQLSGLENLPQLVSLVTGELRILDALPRASEAACGDIGLVRVKVRPGKDRR